jgi:hypothetical protein
MTIGVAWTRQGTNGEELWLATDSRLSGDGLVWDDCPKLVPLPRRDAVAGFSGSTLQAYPLLLQTGNAMSAYRAARDGTLEFLAMVGHVERVINAMMQRLRVDSAVQGAQDGRPEFASRGDTLVIGGYSRLANSMSLRALQYDGQSSRWQFRSPSSDPEWGVLRVFGDTTSRNRFLRQLSSMLHARRQAGTDRPLNFEPLEVMAAMLRMPESSLQPLPSNRRPTTIGGAPQVVRLLAGAAATPVAVRWTDSTGVADYLLGRRSFGYERLDVPLLDLTSNTVQIQAPGQWEPVSERDELMRYLSRLLKTRHAKLEHWNAGRPSAGGTASAA